MCRNIKTLFNFDPPVTEEEIRAASLQFVRKISGFTKPSKANERLFLAAVDEVAGISTRLLLSLETNAPPRNREGKRGRQVLKSLWRPLMFGTDLAIEKVQWHAYAHRAPGGTMEPRSELWTARAVLNMGLKGKGPGG